MRAYMEFAKKQFLNKMVYRFDYIMGVLNTCLQFFIFWCIYKSLYGSSTEVNGITFSMVTTNFVLSLGLSNAFQTNDFFVSSKVRDGSIATELLKPVNFKLRILMEDLGEVTFRLMFDFLPAFIITSFFVEIEKPKDMNSLTLFFASIILGFLILWQISFLVQMTSFWIINVWSVSTIKNVFISVLSGTMLPLWFMPDIVLRLIRYTPFDTIYFTPIKLYMGKMNYDGIWLGFGKQLIWILVLYLIGEIMWRFGQKKIVVYGG